MMIRDFRKEAVTMDRRHAKTEYVRHVTDASPTANRPHAWFFTYTIRAQGCILGAALRFFMSWSR